MSKILVKRNKKLSLAKNIHMCCSPGVFWQLLLPSSAKMNANVLSAGQTDCTCSRKWMQVELAWRLVLGSQTDSQVSSQVHPSRKKKHIEAFLLIIG